MNIHGHKLRIAKIKDEMKKGEMNVGFRRWNILKKRKIMHNNLIKKLRMNKKPRVKKRKR